MMSENINGDRQFTYKELSKGQDYFIKKIDDFIGKAVKLSNKYKGKNCLKMFVDSENEKKESEFMEYSTPEKFIMRRWEYNREHKLDTVMLNEFNQKNDESLEDVKIVYGPASDEYVRQNHALALTVANTIYFRNGAYKPETEEGRKLLTHELTHVVQNNKKDEYRNSSNEEKEQEAESRENQQEYNPDPELIIKINGRYRRIRKSKVKREINTLADNIISKIEIEYAQLPDEEQKLQYLIDLKEKINREEMKWVQ